MIVRKRIGIEFEERAKSNGCIKPSEPQSNSHAINDGEDLLKVLADVRTVEQ